MKKREIIERIMSQHWDLCACSCWVCVEGRAAGCRPREMYLSHHDSTPQTRVLVEQPDSPFTYQLVPTSERGHDD